MTMFEKSAKWYVYTLLDPRDGQIFYVGKGTGNRVHQHEKDAARPETVCSKKIRKIKDIWAAELEVGRQFCAYFWDEQAAYDHETDLIEEIGLERLTNVLPGGQKAWERRKQERASRRPQEAWYAVLAKDGSRTRALYARFADWLKAGLHKGTHTVKVTCSNPDFAVNAMVTEVMYNTMFPWMWERLCADEKAQAIFIERIRPFGIEIVHGGT